MKAKTIKFAALALLLAIPNAPKAAQAGPLFPLLGVQSARLFGQGAGARAQREHKLIIQTSELTCGPAAIASLLTFTFGEATTEDEIAKLSGTYEAHTSTLLSLRNACRSKGYEARGYRMTLTQMLHQIASDGVPVVVHFKEPSLHYALVLGRADDFVLVADPSQGNISMHTTDFLRRWSGNTLVVRAKATQSPDRSIVAQRQRSATIRLQTLNQAGALTSFSGF